MINFRVPGGFSQVSWKQNFDNYMQSYSGLERPEILMLSYRLIIPLVFLQKVV